MSNEGITEGNYRQLLVDMAEWYDRLGYLTMLKVLYRDYVNDNYQLISATKVMDLLRMLIGSENLSSANLSILYDTVKVTQQFGFESKIKDRFPPFKNIKEREVTKFTQNRLKLLKLGTTLTEDDVIRLDGIYNMPLLKQYGDSWSMILDLEQRMELRDGNMDNFIEVLRSNALSWAVKALVDGNEAEPMMFKRPNLVLPVNQDVTIREYLLNRQIKLCRNANRFTPATLNTRYQVDIAHMFTDLEVLKENKKKQGSKQTTLDEVFGIIKSSPSSKILIDGEGGIGKTTLLRYLAYNWAMESDETFKGKLVFPVNIRDMDEGEDILDVIVKKIKLKDFNLKTNLPTDPNLIKRFIMNHDDEIVLLLDGLDELRVRNESPINLFRKEELENSTVVLTSRSENINEYIKESSVHLKVKGFNEHNIYRYIRKYFDYVELPALGDSLIRELSGSFSRPTWRNTHNEEYSMFKNPMLLLSICIMWEDKQHLPADKTDLFKGIYRSILNQFIEKQEPKEQKISRFEDTPDKYVNAMLLLGKCMYNSLKRNQLLINKKDFEGKQEMIALAIKLGFVYKDSPNKDDFDDIFAAPHKLIVESLVGFYLYKVCDSAGLGTEGSNDNMANLLKPLDDNELERVIESEYLQIARECTVGFLGADAVKFLKYLLTNSFSKYRSLMKYLDHVKEGHKSVVIKALDDHLIKKGLKIKRHFGNICKSLMRFKLHFDPDVQDDDEHFIHLMRRIHEIAPRDVSSILVADRIMVVKALINPLKDFCKGLSSAKRGRMFAHIMLAVPDQQLILKGIHEVCADDYVKYLTAEFQILNLKYDFKIYELHSSSVFPIPPITALFLSHLLINAPNLSNLFLYNCLTCVVLNDVIRTYLSRGDKLQLKVLNIGGNNFGSISGSVLGSLMCIAPQLTNLFMSKCSLSVSILSDMIKECHSKGLTLELESLGIKDNDLSNIDESLLHSLLAVAPKLNYIDMRSCSLSADTKNNLRLMINTYSSRIAFQL